MIKTTPAVAFKTANDLAIERFKIHAAQRLTVFNFFLIIAGFCVGGFFTALQATNNLAASVIAIVLMVVSYCFKQLDRRTAQLTKLAECYLEQSLAALGEQLNSEKINFVLLAEDKHGLWSYRKTFNILFWLFGILGVLGAIFPWVQQKNPGIDV
jgi:hypothetical protein